MRMELLLLTFSEEYAEVLEKCLLQMIISVQVEKEISSSSPTRLIYQSFQTLLRKSETEPESRAASLPPI